MTITTRPPLWLIALLGVIGAALSLYSVHHYVALEYGLRTTPSFCNLNATFNCDAVTKSAWASIGGVPIASWGLAFYVILTACVVGGARSTRLPQPLLHGALTLISSIAVLFSIYLFIVSHFFIGTICLVCVALYVVNGALLLVAYRAGRPARWLHQVATGLRALRDLPALALGLGRFRTHPAKNATCGWVALAVVATLVLLTQPQRLFLLMGRSGGGDSATTDSRAALTAAVIETWQTAPPAVVSENDALGPTHDYALGPPNAPIQIVEFSDFECPACRHFYRAIHALMKTYPDKIRLVHRNFPIDQTCNVHIPQEAHANACLAALFTRCAGEQGRFWEAVDYIFTLPSIDAGASDDVVRNDIFSGGAALSIDEAALAECLEDDRQRVRIIEDINEAIDLGIEGTPAVWINSKPLRPPTPENVTAVIEHILRPTKPAP